MLFKEMAMKAPPSKEQTKDIDFLLTVGEMFTLVVYGQFILGCGIEPGIQSFIQWAVLDKKS